MHRSTIPLLAVSALVAADPSTAPAGFNRFAPRQTTITWGPCPNSTSTTIVCGRYEVPLDWANEAAGKASLLVAKYPASQPKLGTLFLNPGGPGGSGLDMIHGHGDTISQVVGGQYDLITWDPRGVGHTLPRADCFATATAENAFWEGTIPRAGLEARGNFTDQVDIDAFYQQVPEVDALLIKLGQQCLQFSPDTFQYVGTTATVRDMVAMHDYFEGPDKPIDYWGLSYGTVIGIYFVNMFPNRVGRVVIDGVVDPVYWANRPPHEIWAINAESTDEALVGFTQACAAAGPDNCAIALADTTPDSLLADIRSFIDMAYDYKKAAGINALFGSSDIRNILFHGMYSPNGWPQLARDLLEKYNFLLANSNSPTKRSLPSHKRHVIPTTKRQTSDPDIAIDYSLQAITCADAMDPGTTTTKDVFDYLVNVTRTVSPMFGPSWGIAGFYCHHWPVRAVERYVGPWNNKLANPILVIGNEADPVTPFRSAKSVADALGDSAVLIEQDDYGHLSLAMHSDCTLTALKNYFLSNTLPSADQFCGTNQQLFPGPGVTKSTLSTLSSTNSNSSSSIQTELDAAQTRARQLFIAVIGLACAVGLLLVFLVGSCLIGKKGGSKQKDVVYWGKDASDDQGHEYKTPYDGVTSLKLGGVGYAPVKT